MVSQLRPPQRLDPPESTRFRDGLFENADAVRAVRRSPGIDVARR
jgi:hypothetical protein